MKQFIIISTLVVLFACNGGGDGVSTPDIIEPIVKRSYHLDEVNDACKFDITGDFSTGQTIEGTYQVKEVSDDTYQQYLFVHILPDDISISTLQTVMPGKIINEITNKEYIKIENGDMPDMAYVGDFGKTATYKAEDGEVIKGTWSLEEATSGMAILVQSTMILDENGNTKSHTTTEFTLSESGYVDSLYLESIEIVSGIKMYLDGSRSVLKR